MAAERRELGDIRPEVSSRQREARIAELARNRHRITTREQLTRLGLGPGAIKHRLATGRLVRRYRGVFVIGPGPLTVTGELLAAVLFAGEDAVLSHLAAAGHHGFVDWRGGVIDVTCPRRVAAPPPIRCHRRRLPRDERTIREGVPTTSSGRTIFDCAAVVGIRDVERMLNEAYVMGLPLKPRPEALLDRYPRRRGTATLKSALEAFGTGPRLTKSDLEERFLAFVDRHRLPRPRTNFPIDTRIGRVRVDCAWPALRYAVELDAPSTHGSRRAMLNDRRRDRALRSIGWRVDRLMEDDLADEPALLTELSGLLAA